MTRRRPQAEDPLMDAAVSTSRDAESGPRPRGRPRDVKAELAILEATLDSFIEEGYRGMNIESVAARAGVAKTTIYRRWPNKEDLLVAAIGSVIEDFPVPDSGDVEADMSFIVNRVHHFITKTRAGEVFPRMAVEVATGTSLGRTYYERVLEPRFNAFVHMLEAAKQRGDLRSDLDVELAVASTIGSMMFLRITRTLPKKRGDLPERLVSQLMGGMRR
jgi:AcrR family transcriptional regulator